ncbi:MAG: Mur ligase family protein [Candidatus Paceibacterota bacterium]
MVNFLDLSKKIIPRPIFNFFQPVYHWLMALAGAIIYRFPSSKIFVLGTTGTKGKSTTLELINTILEADKKRTALLSSIRIKIGEKSKKNYSGNTMPGRFFIQRFLRKAVNTNCQYALIEVTSQGILQYRHRFINWQAAIFTNLAPEHIEAHGSFEKYRKAKTDFFTYIKNKLFFINKDDANAKYFTEAAQDGKIVLYSKNSLNSKPYTLNPNLIGDFNKENIAAAIAFIKSQNISETIIKKAIENFQGVPGRMEFIPAFVKTSAGKQQPFTVVIDYAHTPDSLKNVYETIRNSKLICVLGSAGGGRDKWKRPEMGKIAAEYCDKIILTNEDPYDEKPLEILSQIEVGICINPRTLARRPAFIYKILNRKEAIKKAISLAKPNDTVIITGKGCESFIHIAGGKKIPWNERKIVEEIIK